MTMARRMKLEEFVDEKYQGLEYGIDEIYIEMRCDRFGECLFTQDLVTSVVVQQFIEPKDYLRQNFMKSTNN